MTDAVVASWQMTAPLRRACRAENRGHVERRNRLTLQTLQCQAFGSRRRNE